LQATRDQERKEFIMSSLKRNLALSKIDEIESMIEEFKDAISSDELTVEEKNDLYAEIDKIYNMLTDTSIRDR
jgi:hypothetical protein